MIVIWWIGWRGDPQLLRQFAINPLFECSAKWDQSRERGSGNVQPAIYFVQHTDQFTNGIAGIVGQIEVSFGACAGCHGFLG